MCLALLPETKTRRENAMCRPACLVAQDSNCVGAWFLPCLSALMRRVKCCFCMVPKLFGRLCSTGETACFMCRSLFVRLWSAPCECVFEKSKVYEHMCRNDYGFDSCCKVGTRVPYVTPALAARVYINLPRHLTFLPSNLLKKVPLSSLPKIIPKMFDVCFFCSLCSK
jgi:hypothetical protein